MCLGEGRQAMGGCHWRPPTTTVVSAHSYAPPFTSHQPPHLPPPSSPVHTLAQTRPLPPHTLTLSETHTHLQHAPTSMHADMHTHIPTHTHPLTHTAHTPVASPHSIDHRLLHFTLGRLPAHQHRRARQGRAVQGKAAQGSTATSVVCPLPMVT